MVNGLEGFSPWVIRPGKKSIENLLVMTRNFNICDLWSLLVLGGSFLTLAFALGSGFGLGSALAFALALHLALGAFITFIGDFMAKFNLGAISPKVHQDENKSKSLNQRLLSKKSLIIYHIMIPSLHGRMFLETLSFLDLPWMEEGSKKHMELPWMEGRFFLEMPWMEGRLFNKNITFGTALDGRK